MAQASDVAIVQKAKTHQEIIVTHDLDYGHLLAFSGENDLINTRIESSTIDNLFKAFRNNPNIPSKDAFINKLMWICT